MSRSELEQCVMDINAWFVRMSGETKAGASNAEIERLQKTFDGKIPYALETLLREDTGSIYIFDKKLLSCRDIPNLYDKIEGTPGFTKDCIPFCGDQGECVIIDGRGRVCEWDADDGVGDVISPSFSSYLESYRNKLLSGGMDFVSGVGAVEMRSHTSRK